MPTICVQRAGHWGGDPDLYCRQLTVTVKAKADAQNLARVGRLLAGGDPEALARLAGAAERIAAELASETQLIGC